MSSTVSGTGTLEVLSGAMLNLTGSFNSGSISLYGGATAGAQLNQSSVLSSAGLVQIGGFSGGYGATLTDSGKLTATGTLSISAGRRGRRGGQAGLLTVTSAGSLTLGGGLGSRLGVPLPRSLA